MTNSGSSFGWADNQPDDPEVERLRAYLSANNGMRGLEIFRPTDVEGILRCFRRDGFVLVDDILSPGQVDMLAGGVREVAEAIVALDEGNKGNRGSHRYSFGGSSLTRSMLHHPAWQMMLENERVDGLVTAIFGNEDYMLRAASGDFCLPGAVDYQRLHADVRDWTDPKLTRFSAFHDPEGRVSIRDLPTPYVCVNFLPQEITRLNGPTRQIPGTQQSTAPIPELDNEPEWMRLSTVCPAPAGAVMIRDVRAWHGGTPNVSDGLRAIPNLEFYAPWFREPVVPGISRQAFNRLSPRSQARTRFVVADSSAPLETGYTLQAP